MRSSRGPEAAICAIAKSPPRSNPRIIASAMLPAPMKPIVLSLLMTDGILRVLRSDTHEEMDCRRHGMHDRLNGVGRRLRGRRAPAPYEHPGKGLRRGREELQRTDDGGAAAREARP